MRISSCACEGIEMFPARWKWNIMTTKCITRCIALLSFTHQRDIMQQVSQIRASWKTYDHPVAVAAGAHRRLCARRLSCLRSEEHTSELQSHSDLVCRLLLEKKKDMCQ